MTQLTTRFDEALIYARTIHEGQKRKGSDIPYFAHLLGVASLTLEAGGSEDQAIAALLHDAAEDQGGDLAKSGYGEHLLRFLEFDASEAQD